MDKDQREFYPTPLWCVKALAKFLISHPSLTPEVILDLGAGDGRIGRIVSVNLRVKEVGYVDIAPKVFPYSERDTYWQGDFLDHKLRVLLEDWLFPPSSPNAHHRFVGLVSNPPFTKAVDFVSNALGLFLSGWCAFLLPMSFSGSKIRCAFLEKHPPIGVYPLYPRPSFVKGTTDKETYGWWLWVKGQRSPGEPLKLPPFQMLVDEAKAREFIEDQYKLEV